MVAEKIAETDEEIIDLTEIDEEVIDLTELIDQSGAVAAAPAPEAVSYTHLTLPTTSRV